ncbi:hypothetical protein AAFC00_001614 [Neodothiora populina]|uniref:Uncharacterized protein n=1 Tax=Neodothiora populina TaxID=2781224 RepID=A0ABR3PPL1_9PEZI
MKPQNALPVMALLLSMCSAAPVAEKRGCGSKRDASPSELCYVNSKRGIQAEPVAGIKREASPSELLYVNSKREDGLQDLQARDASPSELLYVNSKREDGLQDLQARDASPSELLYVNSKRED